MLHLYILWTVRISCVWVFCGNTISQVQGKDEGAEL